MNMIHDWISLPMEVGANGATMLFTDWLISLSAHYLHVIILWPI